MKNKFFNFVRGKKESEADTQEMEALFSYGTFSYIGLRRSSNQDSLGVFPDVYLPDHRGKGQLFILADGMGGLMAGKKASEMAVNIIRRTYFEDEIHGIHQSLGRAFEHANAEIYAEATSSDLEHRMGTTCSALILTEDRGVFGHVGDSRIYRIRQDAIVQLTQDHTEVAELIRHDLLTMEEAPNHPNKSILSRALGIEPRVEVDVCADIFLEREDRFVLCTDGLGKVTPEEIKEIVLAKTPQEACDQMVELACQKGSGDNITVMVIHAHLPA